MKILKFTGNLVDTMGDNARGDFEKDLGLKFHNGHQNVENGVTLFEVINEEKADRYINHYAVEVLNQTEANEVLSILIDRTIYKKYDGDLYRVNLQQKTDAGIVNLDLMIPGWTNQQELEYIYNLGVSGIDKKVIITEKFQTQIVEEPTTEDPIVEEP